MVHKRKYVCAECHEPVVRTGDIGGLGTWTCRRHSERTVTVQRDHSGGKEADHMHRAVPVSVRRGTKVQVL